MTYSTGPYSKFTSLPVPPRPEVHSSRKINFTTKQYEIDTVTGGFLGMPSVAQRVAMLVSFEVKDAKFITPPENEKTKDSIVEALKELTDSDPPAIKLTSVEVGSDSAGTAYRRIIYTDLLEGTGIDQTVQLK